MVRQATTVSHLYQAVLRAELARQLGVGWTFVERGIAEVEGLPRTVLRAFSKRRDQIERALEDRGFTGPRPRQAACLATRPAKQHEDPATSRERWHAEAAELGVDADALRRLLDRNPHPPSVDRNALASAVLGPEGVTRDRSTFDRGRLIREVCQHLPPGADVTANRILALSGELLREVCQHLPPGADVTANRILALSGELLRDDEVVPVLTDDGPAYTTVDMLASSSTRSTRSRCARPTASESFPASSPSRRSPPRSCVPTRSSWCERSELHDRVNAERSGGKSLERALGAFGLSPHPKVLLLVEGDTEMRYLPRLLDLLGLNRPHLVRVQKCRSSGVNPQLISRYAIAPRLAERLGDSQMTESHPTRLVIAMDPENRWSDEVKRLQERATLQKAIREEVEAEGGQIGHTTTSK